ncbi:MAG: polysaccharide biosynthesis tyrosine autokinase [Verrucomicrobiota bacterium]
MDLAAQEDLFADDYVESGEVRKSRSIEDYLYWLKRYGWIIALTTVVGLILGAYVYKKTPPMYRAVATIEVERKERATSVDSAADELRFSGEAWMNTIAQKLTLPRPYQRLAEDPTIAERTDLVRKEFSFFEDPKTRNGTMLPPEAIAGMMVHWVKPEPREGSNLIDITVEHTSPKVAQLVANGLLDAYRMDSEKKVGGENTSNIEILQAEIEEIESSILELGKRLALYKGSNDTRVRILAVEQEIIDLEKKFLEKWPPLIEAKSKLDVLRKRFDREIAEVRTLSPDEDGYWKSLPVSIDPIKNVETRANLIAAELSNKEQFRDRLLAKMDEADVGAKVFREFSVQRDAFLPGRPFSPKQTKVLAMFTAGGMAIGVGIVFLIGFLDPTARAVSELEGMFDIPVVGAIPRVKPTATVKQEKQGGPRKRLTPAIIQNEKEPAAESIRNLRASLSFLGKREDRKSFLLTSCFPGEGKSWIAANLASSFASQNERTLIIDLDLRKPMIHRIFGLDRTPGITDLLTQDVRIADTVRETDIPNLRVITAGTTAPNPAELLNHMSIRKILENVSTVFDRIIVDTPPVLAVRDALGPAKLVNSTIIVFKMAKTPVKALGSLMRILQENQTQPSGIVANDLPPPRKDGYYKYNYHYGYGYGGEYYGEEAEETKAKEA